MSWIPFMKKDKKTTNIIEGFEKDLKKISLSIKELNLKTKNTSKQLINVKTKFLLYTATIYISYLTYILVIVGFHNSSTVHLILCIMVPFAMSFVKSLINIIYNKRINSYELRIELLKEQHQEKIEELKDATNFNKTQDLLLKFDENGEDLEAKRKQQEEFFKQLELAPPGNDLLFQQQKPQSYKVTALDRLLNVVIGEDEYAANKRYALICEKCYLHNGLAPPGQLAETVKYICPNCGTLNNESAASKEEEESILEVEGSTGVEAKEK